MAVRWLTNTHSTSTGWTRSTHHPFTTKWLHRCNNTLRRKGWQEEASETFHWHTELHEGRQTRGSGCCCRSGGSGRVSVRTTTLTPYSLLEKVSDSRQCRKVKERKIISFTVSWSCGGVVAIGLWLGAGENLRTGAVGRLLMLTKLTGETQKITGERNE